MIIYIWCLCLSKLNFLKKFLLQLGHSNIFFLSWKIALCFPISRFWKNSLVQILHNSAFLSLSPLCSLVLWISKQLFLKKPYLHTSHLYGFFPWWTDLMWEFILFLSKKFLPQIVHLNNVFYCKLTHWTHSVHDLLCIPCVVWKWNKKKKMRTNWGKV